jgi:5-methyltetrahydrofolate--homocysteine methyltransferase
MFLSSVRAAEDDCFPCAGRPERLHALKQAAEQRILVLDGGWGALIQERGLTEADFRGDRFQDHASALKGDNDLLCLTRPDLVAEIHDAYFAAGADIASTNTFNANAISQADYGLEWAAAEINRAGAELARVAADRSAGLTGRPRFVAGCLGPMNRTLSISPDVDDPAARAVTFEQVYDAYREQAFALHQGGVDLFLIETVFDTLNAKAAIKAILDLQDEGLASLPLWISGTITDRSGRLLSGQTVDAFWASIRHAKPWAVGLNCALGAELMRPYLAELSRIADCLVAGHPNAGLPNAFGGYDEQPHETACQLCGWAQDGLVNILGGCCGTTPDHIRELAASVQGAARRTPPARRSVLQLSGLEALELA